MRVLTRNPIGHYRVPHYVRGKVGVVELVVEPRSVNNEEEAYGNNSGDKRFYYRVAFQMKELWPEYLSGLRDGLRIEIFETWLEGM